MFPTTTKCPILFLTPSLTKRMLHVARQILLGHVSGTDIITRVFNRGRTEGRALSRDVMIEAEITEMWGP